MVFPRRKRASDLNGGRFWHPKIEMRPLKKLRRMKRHAARTRINSATSCSQSFVGANPIIVEENDNVIAGHSILSV
jgi:hypothetical protein